jgi:hypothetical protein
MAGAGKTPGGAWGMAEGNGPDGVCRAMARAPCGLALAKGDGAGRALEGLSWDRTLDRGC